MSDQDETAPLSYERKENVVNTKLPTVKVVLEDLTVQVQEGEPRKERKIVLKQYSGGINEDAEHFIEAFEHMKKELVALGQWYNVDDANVNATRVPLLFVVFDKILTGNATQDWYEVLSGPVVQTGKDTVQEYIIRVSKFFTTKAFTTTDAYKAQKDYMASRMKPSSLSFVEWFKQIKTLNRMLPYMLDRPTKRTFPESQRTKRFGVSGH